MNEKMDKKTVTRRWIGIRRGSTLLAFAFVCGPVLACKKEDKGGDLQALLFVYLQDQQNRLPFAYACDTVSAYSRCDNFYTREAPQTGGCYTSKPCPKEGSVGACLCGPYKSRKQIVFYSTGGQPYGANPKSACNTSICGYSSSSGEPVFEGSYSPYEIVSAR